MENEFLLEDMTKKIEKQYSGDKVVVNQRKVSCDGSGGALGHPKVYLEIKEHDDEIICPYCSRVFIYSDDK